jgi:hypothetical protein
MTQQYLPFVNPVEAQQAWESNKERWLKFLVASYAKTGVKTAAASAVNHFTFNVLGAIFEAPALVKTYRHLDQLEDIQKNNTNYPCRCQVADGDGVTCSNILEYTIEQKQKKKKRRFIGAVPVIGTLESLRAGFHAATKSNRGGQREMYAKMLHMKARNCPKGQATVAELLGNYRYQDSWEAMFSLCDWEEGWKVLKEKMAST